MTREEEIYNILGGYYKDYRKAILTNGPIVFDEIHSLYAGWSDLNSKDSSEESGFVFAFLIVFVITFLFYNKTDSSLDDKEEELSKIFSFFKRDENKFLSTCEAAFIYGNTFAKAKTKESALGRALICTITSFNDDSTKLHISFYRMLSKSFEKFIDYEKNPNNIDRKRISSNQNNIEKFAENNLHKNDLAVIKRHIKESTKDIFRLHRDNFSRNDISEFSKFGYEFSDFDFGKDIRLKEAAESYVKEYKKRKRNSRICKAIALVIALLFVGDLVWMKNKYKITAFFNSTPYNKCMASKTKDYDTYCKEDGTVGSKTLDEQLERYTSCLAKSPYFVWNNKSSTCERITYESKEACIADGREGAVSYDREYFVTKCNDDGTWTTKDRLDILNEMVNDVPKKYVCEDITSFDYDWGNDMVCTAPDGSQFYTSYEGAQYYHNKFDWEVK